MASPANELRGLARMLHQRFDGPRWMAMLELILDDGGSQTNPGDPVFGIGGYIAPAEQWQSVTEAWQTVLDELGSPPYHATDCEPGADGYGHADFRDWTADQLLTLKKRLAPLTHGLTHGPSTGAGIGRGLIVSEFNEMMRDDPAHRRKVRGSSYWPLYMVFEAALDWAAMFWPDKPPGERIAVTFEGGTHQLTTAATHLYRWLRQHYRWAAENYVPACAIGTKEMPALQAADMLAFEVYKAKRNQLDPRGLPERKMLTELCRYGRIDIRYCARTDYAKTRDAFLAWEREWIRATGEAV